MNKNILKSITDISEENITKKVVNNIYHITIGDDYSEYIVSNNKKKVYHYCINNPKYNQEYNLKNLYITETFRLYNHLYDDYIINIIENYSPIYDTNRNLNRHYFNIHTYHTNVLRDYLFENRNNIDEIKYIYAKFDKFYETMTIDDLEKIEMIISVKSFIRNITKYPINFI